MPALHNALKVWKQNLWSNQATPPPTITTEKLSWPSFHHSWWRIWGTQNMQLCSRNTCSSKRFLHLPGVFSGFFAHIEWTFTKLSGFNFCLVSPSYPFLLFLHKQIKVMILLLFYFSFLFKALIFYPFTDHSLVMVKGLCNSVKLWAMPCRATQDTWVTIRVLTKCDLLGEEMANHSSILAVRTPEQYEKARIYDTGRWIPPVRRCLRCYWGRAEGNY